MSVRYPSQSTAHKTPIYILRQAIPGCEDSHLFMSCLENEVCKGMEATQMINDSILESDEDENEEDTNKRGQPLAKLRILKNQHISETEFPLYVGDNVLGRDPSTCTLTLAAASVSKQHATICVSIYRRRGEVNMEAVVWDHGSMNGTRKGHLKLTPNVRYALSESDSLVVADIPCQYVRWSTQTSSSQGDTRTPLSQNSGLKGQFPDASRENEGDTSTDSKKCVDRGIKSPVSLKSTERGSCLSFERTPIQPQETLVPESDSDSDGERGGKAGRSRNCLVSESDSHKSSPNCSTFLSPVNKTIPESEDESPITPSTSHKNRPHRHVSFTTEETDEDAGRQELHKTNMNVCEAEKGRQEKRASEGGSLTPRKEDSNVSPSEVVESPVSNPVIPAFNMDSDTDVEGEEEGVMSAGVESAVPMIVNTNHQVDRPPDTVHFHMDSDTDNSEDENADVLSKAPEMLPSRENPQVISVSVVTMDSDTDVDEDATVSDAAPKVIPTSFQSACSADSASSVQIKEFHLDSDTDAEEEEEERGAKTPNSKHETSNKLDIKLIGPNSTSAAPNSLNLDSDTDEDVVAVPSDNKSSSAATVTELIAATDVGADLDILSDSDTDVEGNFPLVTPPAVQTLAGTALEATQPDSDADTDVDEPKRPPAVDLANQVEKADSDTDVDDDNMNIVVAGVDQIPRLQGDVTPGIPVPLRQLNCSTPLQLPDEVAEMDTQAFISPLSAPSVRPAVLPSSREYQEDEDFAEAETQAFLPDTRECKNSSQTFILDPSVDKKDHSSRGESLRLGLSDSDHLQSPDQTVNLQSTHVEDTQAKASVSVENDSKGQQAYETTEKLAKCSLMPNTGVQRNFDLEDTQPYISELCGSDSEDDEDVDEDQNDAPTENEPIDFGMSSTIAMAETQLISSTVEEIMTTPSHISPVQQTKLAIHDIGATQPMATCGVDNSDSEDSQIIPRKRKAKKLHLEDEATQELTNSDVFIAETQPLAPSEDEDNDTDSIIGPHKRKAKPLQIENESQSLPGSELSAVETQPLVACEGEQSDEADFSPGPRKRKAKNLQFEVEQTQPLANSDASTLETRPLLTPNDEATENKASFSGKRKEKRLHLTDEETQPLNNSDISTVETQPPNTETCPSAVEESVKECENDEANTDGQRQTQASIREVQQQEECSVLPKRQTRGQQKSLPSTKGKKGKTNADEDKEEVDQTNGARLENITRLEKDDDGGLEMEPIVNKSIAKEGEIENLGGRNKDEVQQETLQVENAARTKKEKKEEQKQVKPQTPARGRRGRRTVAARSTMSLVSSPDDVPARRTRSRSNSSNSVSSEMSASSFTNQESKGRGRGRGATRTSEIPQTTGRSTRKTVAAGATLLDKGDINPQGLVSTSIMSDSLNAEALNSSVSSPNKGRGGKRRGKETRTEPCSESIPPVISQSPQLSAPAARGRKSRKTERYSEVIHEDDQSKTDSHQSFATRGRRQASANGSQASEKDHTDQEKESLLPKRNTKGRGQKIEKSETVEEAMIPTVSDCSDAKYNNGKRKSECGSNRTEKIPKTDAAKEERGKKSSAATDTQAKPDAKTALDVKVKEEEACETETVKRKVRGRSSVAAKKKKEESRESEASASSMETDRSELPETPSNRASRKRQAAADSPLLAAKSLRSSAASPIAIGRRRDSSQTYRVLFTGMEDEAGKKVLVRLGGVMAKGVADMNCLVTDKVRRTVKFLCAVAKGIPVVTTEWLEKSGKSGSFLSTSAFLVKDVDQEEKFNFTLEKSLSAASSQPLFQGYEIHVTKSVLPEPVHMKEIIACSGAKFLPKMPSSHKPSTVVISCKEDWPLCGPAVSASVPVVTAEFILTGILQQKIDYPSYELCLPVENLQAAGRRRSKKKM